jgi:hypothetical protein
LRQWSIDARQTARSALPVDVYSGSGYLGNGQLISLRPDVIAGVPIYLNDPKAPGGRTINLNAFSRAPGPVGNEPRNSLRGFAAWQTDLTVRREFALFEQLKLQLRIELFNVFNHPNFGTIDNSTTDGLALFGRAKSTLNNSLGGLNSLYQMGGPRSLQLSLRLAF